MPHLTQLSRHLLKGRRNQVVPATKFGIVSHSGGGPGVLDSRRRWLQEQVRTLEVRLEE